MANRDAKIWKGEHLRARYPRTEKHKPRYARRIAGGIGDCSGRSDVDARKREALESQASNHGIEIPDSCIECHIANGSIRSTHAAYVVPNDGPPSRRQLVGDTTNVMPGKMPVIVGIAENI